MGVTVISGKLLGACLVCAAVVYFVSWLISHSVSFRFIFHPSSKQVKGDNGRGKAPEDEEFLLIHWRYIIRGQSVGNKIEIPLYTCRFLIYKKFHWLDKHIGGVSIQTSVKQTEYFKSAGFSLAAYKYYEREHHWICLHVQQNINKCDNWHKITQNKLN